MRATCVVVRNPFDPRASASVHDIESGRSVAALLDDCGIPPEKWGAGADIIIGGEPVDQGVYAVRVIRPGELVTVSARMMGGGGGGGGKNPLRTVLTIAVMVAAAWAGGAFGPGLAHSMFLGGAQGPLTAFQMAIGKGLVAGAVSLVGGALVNVLVPPPKPTAASSNFGATGYAPAPSPTYSLQAQGNQARLGEPIPVIYGRHVVYPDFATAPYTEYANNEQYLHQLHVLGQGEYDVEQLRIEDTPISSFEEITYEVVAPGGTVTLFDVNVVTAPEVAGQELLSTGDGGAWIGPFAASPAETTCTKIGFDVVLPRGLYYANDSGGLDSRTSSWDVEARPIDDDGNPTGDGSWTVLGNESVTLATNTPQRFSYSYTVAAGRYEVRAIRTNAKDTSSRAGSELRWTELRAYLDEVPDWGDVTLLAMRMRATDNLSQRSSRLVNCIITRKLASWHPDTGWSAPAASTSIAWALADVCRADYGAKLADERMDLDALYLLDQTWTARGDAFNAVFDAGTTVWEALERIARCGRAVPFLQGGVVRFIRDEQKSLPVALFSPRNIVKGSLKIEYLMPSEETADAVTVEWFNPKTWKPDETTQSLAGSNEERPAKVRLFGCTDKAQADREGLYMAAANRYRRKTVTFSTELEGLIPTYGDLIAVSHDMPSWGQGGEATDWDAGTRTLTLSEPVTFEAGQDHYVALRGRDGSVVGPYLVTAGTDDKAVVLSEDPSITPYTGTAEERTHFAFGVGEDWALSARVISVRPRGDLVEITAVGEDSRVHVN